MHVCAVERSQWMGVRHLSARNNPDVETATAVVQRRFLHHAYLKEHIEIETRLTMGLVTSAMQTAFTEFFKIFGFMCTSDFVTTATPVMIVVVLLWRIFGPADQSLSFGQHQVAELERMDLVDETTYGGGRGYPSNQSARGDGAGSVKKDKDI